MKVFRALILPAFILITLTPCFAHHMAVVVNRDSNVAEVSSAHLAKIFLLEDKKWPGGKEIVIVLHKQSAGETVTLQHLSRMNQKDLQSFIAAHKAAVALVDSDDEVLRFVQSTPGALGLVDVRSINDQVRVLKVDGKLPMEEGYLPH